MPIVRGSVYSGGGEGGWGGWGWGSYSSNIPIPWLLLITCASLCIRIQCLAEITDILLSTTQGTPAGVPSLVQPSGAKIDIEQLRHDIPKYNALSEGDKQWWLQFLEETESSLNSTVSVCSTWPLGELLDITESHPRVQLNVEHASEQLQQLHQSTKKTHVVCLIHNYRCS